MNRVDNFLRPVSVSVLNKERRGSQKRTGNLSRASGTSTNKVTTPNNRESAAYVPGGLNDSSINFT